MADHSDSHDVPDKKLSQLCYVCDQIGTSDARWFINTQPNSQPGLGIYVHRRDLHSLRASATKGCRLCGLILSTVVNSDDARQVPTLSGDIFQDCVYSIKKRRGLTSSLRLLQKYGHKVSPATAYCLPTTFKFNEDIRGLHLLSKLCGIGRVILIGTAHTNNLPSNLRAVVLYPFGTFDYQLFRTPFIAGHPFELATRLGMEDSFPIIEDILMPRVRPDDPLEPLATAWVASPTLFTERLLHRIRCWRQICLTEHPKCRVSSGPQPLPSRVIVIPAEMAPHKVRLQDTRGQNGIYAALSYCWGTSSHKMTTKLTLSEHLGGFPVSTLPATIRDAIKLCHSLEIPYLWVDSLCIIQDDSEDWHKEATEMAAIYGRAALMISTPQNSGCDESFNDFGNIASGDSSLPQILWEHRHLQEKVTGIVSVRPTASIFNSQTRGTFWVGKQDSPWMTRGWTLQEWLLSPRVLHCGKERMWDCYQTWYTETSSMIHISEVAVFDSVNVAESSPSYAFARMARIDPQVGGSALDTYWARLVEEYTSRTLSREMDKMPAIAGLAAKFMEHSHTKALAADYLAGLWYYKGMYPFEGHKYPTSQIPLGLLWRRSSVEYMRSPDTYRAPSWSWASLDGPVSLFRLQWPLLEIVGSTAGSKDYLLFKNMEILAVRCLFDPPGSFSLVQTGWIIASSLLKRAYVSPSWKVAQFHTSLQAEYHKTFAGLSTHRRHDETPWFAIFDQDPENTGIDFAEESLYVIQVATVTRQMQEGRLPIIIHHALVAEKVGTLDGIDCFRRLGVAWYYPKDGGQWNGGIDGPANEWIDRHMLRNWENQKIRLI